MGISYIPNKYYAIAIPTWIAVTAWLLTMGYAASGLYFAHNRDSFFTMQDRHSCPVKNQEDLKKVHSFFQTGFNDESSMEISSKYFTNREKRLKLLKQNYTNKLPEIIELPITVVNRVLYA